MKLERKPMELLILLATREGDLVTRTEIAERLWGSEVFVDTEHGINTAIRKIRQTFRDDPDQPRFVQTVMGKGYRFIGPISEAHPPPAAKSSAPMLAPQPESVPLGAVSVPTATTTESSGAIRNSRRRPAGRVWQIIGGSAAIVLLTLAVSLRAHWSQRSSTRSATPNIQSIAVLPLDNLSGDPSQNYFADGMTDELTTMLAKNSTLHVISRTSAMQYKGAHRPLREIAQALGVDGILEGSVERSGDKVHMTIQLIQGPTDTHLWAESYDRNANDVVTLPEQAAQAIAKRLNSSVPSSAPVRYVSPEAHDAYLHGRYLWFASQNDKAGEYFKKATELQPDYALGWSGLASYYGVGTVQAVLDPRQALPAMAVAARKAIVLDDSLPEAHLTAGANYYFYNWDWVRADQEILRAIALDPKFAEAHFLRAKILASLNRHQEAIDEQKKAMEIDPFARPWALAYFYLAARQFDPAVTDGLQRLDSTPYDPTLHCILSVVYRCKGMYKESVQELEQTYTFSGDKASAAGVRRAFEQGGYPAALRWQIGDMESSKRYVSPVNLALAYAQLGKREETLALLEEGYRQRSPQLFLIQDDPAFDFLHKDERYRSLIRRIGLPPAW